MMISWSNNKYYLLPLPSLSAFYVRGSRVERDAKQRHQFRYTAHPCENRDHATPTQRAVPQIVIIPRPVYPKGTGSCERVHGGSLVTPPPSIPESFVPWSSLPRDRIPAYEQSLRKMHIDPYYFFLPRVVYNLTLDSCYVKNKWNEYTTVRVCTYMCNYHQ